MTIAYKSANLAKMKITAPENKKRLESYVITSTFADGSEAEFSTSRRFWSSFNRKFAITDNIFTHFTPDEVFQRIASGPLGKETFRLTLEAGVDQKSEALGISALKKTVITPDMVQSVVKEYGGTGLRYGGGVYSATFAPQAGGSRLLKIGGDDFNQRFNIDFPIDGVGGPTATLALLRSICVNGLVGLSPLFQSDIIIDGENPMNNLSRAVQSYNNEEGWHQLAERLQSAQTSFPSVREVTKAEEVLVKMGVTVDVQKTFKDKFGSVERRYNLASANEISKKLQAQLPMNGTVYDLFNFMTEVTSHSTLASVAAKQNISHGLIGDMLTEAYDLEGTAKKSTQFEEVFLKKKAA